MDRVAIFVDAGYVFAQGSALLVGEKLPRSEILIDHEAAARAFADFASKVSGVPLLRIYWYDGTSVGPTAQHLTLAHLDNVKVRLGFVNNAGQQKGVDSLIITDMIELARNRAISDAVLISGDEDLRVGVQQAQEFGVRVHLVGIKPSRGSQSLSLLQEADATYEWSNDEVSAFLGSKVKPSAPSTSVSTVSAPAFALTTTSDSAVTDQLGSVVAKVAGTLEDAELVALIDAFEATRQLPPDIDRRLLGGGRSAIRRDLDSAEKKQVRALFTQVCRQRVAGQS